MNLIILLMAVTRVFSLDTVGITKEELKVASENSRKLADELTGIVEALKAELEQEKSGRRLSVISDDTEDLDNQDDDKVENVLLQFQINKLEQEINKLTQTAAAEGASTGTSSDQRVKTNKSNNNRKKYRRMLARFYYG